MTAGATLITLCTYNERENLQRLVESIFEYAPDVDVLIIDDSSPDGTGRVAAGLAKQHGNVHVRHRPGKQGLGSAMLAGYRWAMERHYEWLINLDADFSHHPRYLPAIRKAAADADVVIGSRYIPGGGIEGWTWQRHLMSRAVNAYARLLLRLKTRDNSGAYRAYRLSRLAELDLDKIRSAGYSFQEEILYRCRRIGCRIVEVPIVFENRRLGQSKINAREAASALWILFALGIENIRGVPVRAADTNSRPATPVPHR